MKRIFILSVLFILFLNSKAQVFSMLEQNPAAAFIPRDGAATVKYDNKLYLIGGWNPILIPYPHFLNDFWVSADDGKTWTQLPDAPFTPRHTHGAGVLNNKLYVWGGDGLKDVWYYDAVTRPGSPTWVQVTADWGPELGDRNFFVSCIHNGFIYVGLGVDSVHSDLYRSRDGQNWFKVGNDFTGDLVGRSRASMISFKGDLYIVGGGQYNTGGHTLYGSVWKSKDDGVTWEKILDNNDRLKTIWGNLAAMDGYMFFVRGIDETGINTKGILYTNDGITWNEFNYAILPRHATSVWGAGNKIYIVAGNLYNDCYTITKIADDY